MDTKLTKQRKWQLKNKATGLCQKCGLPNDQTISLCSICGAKDSARKRKAVPTIRGPYKSKYRPEGGTNNELGIG